jgi:predicted nucleic acid-binding protein
MPSSRAGCSTSRRRQRWHGRSGWAKRSLAGRWAEFDVVEADDVVVRRAAELAEVCGLRGYDAVHCASAEQLDDGDLVVASGDRELLAACVSLGLSTADVDGQG